MTSPTEAELQILRVLWQLGPSTVRTVNERLNAAAADRTIGYTTTLKLMQLMFDKSLVSRDTSSRSHVYAALLPREKARKSLLKRVVDTAFGGSRQELMLHALGQGESSPEELAELRKIIEELEKKNVDG